VEATRDFYVRLLGFEVAMDMGWIVTLASPENPTAQISLSAGDPDPENDGPVLTIEVRDVDDVSARALASQVEVVLPIRDEEWGVRRFFLRDPDGRVVNVMTQPGMMA
jgi:catechol 2,3-dioxygenase-like lactoylglutathione lyase family enzyme